MGMKHLLRNWVLVAVLAGLSGSAWAQARIATVDMRKLFDGYWKTKTADAALKDRAAELDKEYKNLREDHKKASEEYQKQLADANDQAVSAEEREKRKRAAEGKLKDIKDAEETILQFERSARTTLDEQRRRMRDNILAEIRTAVNSRAKAGNFALVLDSAAETPNSTPVFVYTTNENDLTDSVLDLLNATKPLETTKAAEPKDTPKEGKKDKK